MGNSMSFCRRRGILVGAVIAVHHDGTAVVQSAHLRGQTRLQPRPFPLQTTLGNRVRSSADQTPPRAQQPRAQQLRPRQDIGADQTPPRAQQPRAQQLSLWQDIHRANHGDKVALKNEPSVSGTVSFIDKPDIIVRWNGGSEEEFRGAKNVDQLFIVAKKVHPEGYFGLEQVLDEAMGIRPFYY